MIDWCLVFNATFSNSSAKSWRPVWVVKEAGVPGENRRPWASNWSTLSLAVASRVHPFCNLQSRARTNAVLVIGLYDLLGNPTYSLIEPPGSLYFYNVAHPYISLILFLQAISNLIVYTLQTWQHYYFGIL